MPPVTSRLVQQLSPVPPSFAEPQLVIPGPPGAQLAGTEDVEASLAEPDAVELSLSEPDAAEPEPPSALEVVGPAEVAPEAMLPVAVMPLSVGPPLAA
jgi:hypothetical protein